MFKLIRAMSLWRERFSTSDKIGKFRMVASLFLDAPYDWGSENPLRTDCSGLICGIFTIMGYPIRITATGLYESVFTKGTSPDYEKDKIKAWFLLAKEAYDTPGGRRPKGTARHVGLVYGKGVLYHASHPAGATLETIDEVRRAYSGRNTELVFRELNWDDLEKMKGTVYGLDEELL